VDASSVDVDLPAVHRVDALKDLHEGGLARAVAPSQRVHLALLDLQTDVSQDGNAVERLVDPAHLDHGGGVESSPLRAREGGA